MRHWSPSKSVLFCALLAGAVLSGRAQDAAETAHIEWPSAASLTFAENGALEFSLRLPEALTEGTLESNLPDVSVWFLENDAAQPVPGAPPAGRALVLRSPHPSEWLVQVRGLHLPSVEKSAPALLVRWKFLRRDKAKAEGDIRYPGKIISGSAPLDVIMLMDGSWSMNESDPKRQRVAAVRDFIESARHSGVIGRVGIVQFDNHSVTLQALTPLSGDFNSAIERISAVGLTDIDGGIRHTLRMFEETGSSGAAIVLFTDGNQEPGPYKDGHLLARKAGVAIHTMTLGRDADRDLLKRIAAETGGSYADAQKDNDISAAYAAIVGKLIHLHTISSAPIGATGVTMPLDASCTALQISVAALAPGTLMLELPGGKQWSSGEAGNPQYFAEQPAAGELRANWMPAASAKNDATATFTASARTALYPLFFKASPLPASPVEIDANDPNLAVSLFNGGAPLKDAHVEAVFDYERDELGAKVKQHVVAALFDDGKHSDVAPGDGLYASGDEALAFIANASQNLSGTLKVVVSGVENAQPFRREIVAPFETRRAAPPALLVNKAYDFGTHFPGEKASAEVDVWLRGPGGEFSAALDSVPPEFATALKFQTVPAALKSKQRIALPLTVEVSDAIKPGAYSGSVKLSLKGVGSRTVGWSLTVAPVAFSAVPARVDLGELFPGDERKLPLKLSTAGGTLRVAKVLLPPLIANVSDATGAGVKTEFPLLGEKPFEAFELGVNGHEIELRISIPARAGAAVLDSELTFVDAENRTVGRVPFALKVAALSLKPIAPLDFGAVEPGDSLQRELRIEWSGGQHPPLVPKILVLNQPAYVPQLSVPTQDNAGWNSRFSLALPPEILSGELGGTLAIESGPARMTVVWTARVIRPALEASATALDFGRVYPGKKSARTLNLRAIGARPVEVTVSVIPFKKPKVSGVELPAAALNVPEKLIVNPGASVELPLVFALPDEAQDGQYQTALTLSSRLGRIEIPLTVKAVDVIDAAAFHVSPPSITFHINDGEALPVAQFTVTSHDDDLLQVALKIPAQKSLEIPAENAAKPALAAPLAYLFAKQPSASDDNSAALNLELPPRGSLTVFIRPRGDVADGAFGAVLLDGGGEHQELELRVERFAAPVVSVAPEPPRLLNYILSFFVLLLLIAAVLVHLLVKRAGARCVCYAALVHLAVFSMALPKQAILDALPESVEITLLDAQESLGMSLSSTQSRRLDALHAGAGASDDKRAAAAAPAGAQNALAQNGPGAAELPAPSAGPASPQPGPVNLAAARGVEHPLQPAAVPEQARGSRNADPADDAPLAMDAAVPPVKQQPAPAEKISPEAPRAAAVNAASAQFENIETTLPALASYLIRADAAPSADAPRRQPGRVLPDAHPVASEQPLAFPSVQDSAAAQRFSIAAVLEPAVQSSDAPLAFDNEPAAAPQVRAHPQLPPHETARSQPVSAALAEQNGGAPGDGPQALREINIAAPGRPGPAGDAPGESFVALARTGALPIAAAYAGLNAEELPGGRAHSGAGQNETAETGAGAGRAGGGLPGGGDEPLAIGTDGGDGPGGRARSAAAGNSGNHGGSGSGNGNSLIGSVASGNGRPGFGGGGENGSGGRSSAAGNGAGGFGGDGVGLADGSGDGTFELGTLGGRGAGWHGRPGNGWGSGAALAAGPNSAALEGGGNGLGHGAGGNGQATDGGGKGRGGSSGGAPGSNGGTPGGKGFGPGGRLPGFGLQADGPGGFGDKPLAVGPEGGGGQTPGGKGLASGGGLPGGKGGRGGSGLGRTGAAGGNGLGDLGGGGSGPGGFGGTGVASSDGRPGGMGKGVKLARGPGSQELEESNAGRLSKALGVIAGPPNRGISTPYTGGLVRVNIGLAKHSGDWNSSPTALQFLRSAFIERSGLPELEVGVPTVDLSDLPALMKCRVIMITSNFPVLFKPAEIEGMREYLKRGGTLWVNDSSASDYEKFDEAFRPQVPLLVPGATLLKLPLNHDFFSACYDLSKGFKGFRIPPGDKYRQDYMEAAFMPDEQAAPGALAEVADPDAALAHRRAGIIYTRNDYSDGLEIDPRMNAGMKSLTDLTNAEMLESSLRFGMNLVAYAMGSQGLKLPPPPETIAEFEKIYRYKGPALPVLDDFSVLEDQWHKPVWVAEKEWCNETQLDFKSDGGKTTLARVACKAGPKFKAAITRFALTDLSAARALVFDLHSGLTQGLNVSLMFHTKDGRDYESRAVFVRPGWNRGLRFPLALGDLKSGSSKIPWQAYDNAFEPRDAVERISVLLYNLNESGTIQIGPLSLEK